jgi:hypothetical protein
MCCGRSVPLGLTPRLVCFSCYPGLTPWANICRPCGAVAGGILVGPEQVNESGAVGYSHRTKRVGIPIKTKRAGIPIETKRVGIKVEENAGEPALPRNLLSAACD